MVQMDASNQNQLMQHLTGRDAMKKTDATKAVTAAKLTAERVNSALRSTANTLDRSRIGKSSGTLLRPATVQERETEITNALEAATRLVGRAVLAREAVVEWAYEDYERRGREIPGELHMMKADVLRAQAKRMGS